MTPVPYSRRDLAVLTLALLPLAAALRLTLGSSPLPYLDYWPAFAGLFDASGRFVPSGLLHFGNEHPLFLPSLIFALNAKLTGGSDVVLGAVAVGFAGLGVLAVWTASRQAGHWPAWAAVTIGAACVLTTPQGAHNLLFGMSGCAWWLANACAVWAVVVMARGRTALATVLGLAGLAAYGTGMAAVPAVLVAGWLRRTGLPKLLAAGVVLAAAVAWLTLNYGRPAGSPETTFDPIVVGRGVLLLAGRLAGPSPDLAVLVGTPLVVIALMAIGSSVRTRDMQAATGTGLLVFSLAAMAMIAIGRGQSPLFVDEGMTASRYASISAWFWVALGIHAISRPVLRAGFLPLTVSAVLLSQVTGSASLEAVRQLERQQDELGIAIALGLAEQAPRFQAGLAPTLRALGHYPFNDRFTDDCGLRGTRPTVEPTSPADAEGQIEGWLPPWGEALRSAGWLHAARPVDCLLVLDRRGDVVGAAARGFHRHDIGTKLGLTRYDLGWQAVVRVGESPYRAAVRFRGETTLRVLPGTLAAP
jgi:hypothetical protein